MKSWNEKWDMPTLIDVADEMNPDPLFHSIKLAQTSGYEQHPNKQKSCEHKHKLVADEGRAPDSRCHLRHSRGHVFHPDIHLCRYVHA